MASGASPTEIVQGFCTTWEQGEYDRFAEYLADDAVFHMLPIDPVVGIPGIVAECQKLDGLGQTKIRITNLAAAGNVVFTERIDALEMSGRVGELPVTGVFEIEDGKIAAWRDYFDMKQALDAFGLDEVI